MNLHTLARYDFENGWHGTPPEANEDATGEYLKFDDVDALIKKIVLRLEMMDSSRMTAGHGETREFYPVEPIKRLIADLSAPKNTAVLPSIGKVGD